MQLILKSNWYTTALGIEAVKKKWANSSYDFRPRLRITPKVYGNQVGFGE